MVGGRGGGRAWRQAGPTDASGGCCGRDRPRVRGPCRGSMAGQAVNPERGHSLPFPSGWRSRRDEPARRAMGDGIHGRSDAVGKKCCVRSFKQVTSATGWTAKVCNCPTRGRIDLWGLSNAILPLLVAGVDRSQEFTGNKRRPCGRWRSPAATPGGLFRRRLPAVGNSLLYRSAIPELAEGAAPERVIDNGSDR